MRDVVICAAAVFSLSLGQAAAAQELKPPSFFAPPTKPAPKATVDWNWRPSAAPASPAAPEVICGMTVMPADPRVDPKMKTTAPDRGVAFAMRTVEPTVCKPAPR